MRILAIISGEYGRRHVANIRENGPQSWLISEWQAPAVLPPVIDYPEDYLPESFEKADLILSFAELKGVAELLPDAAGPFVPDAFTNTRDGRGITWGLSHFTNAARDWKRNHTVLTRFDCDLSQEIHRVHMRVHMSDVYCNPHVFQWQFHQSVGNLPGRYVIPVRRINFSERQVFC